MIFNQNFEHKHRTKVYVMNVTEELSDWEDSRNMDRKRQWFAIDDALQQLALHKPIQRRYLQQLKNLKTSQVTTNLSSSTTSSSTSSTITQSMSPADERPTLAHSTSTISTIQQTSPNNIDGVIQDISIR